MSDAPQHWLSIVFLSNEHPWHTNRYDPVPGRRMTREEAIEWAQDMQTGLYDYQVTLFEDGEVIPYARPDEIS